MKKKAPGPDRELFRIVFSEAWWSALLEKEAAPASAAETAAELTAPPAPLRDLDRGRREGVQRLGAVVDAAALAFVHDLFVEMRHRRWPLVFGALHPRFWQVFAAPAFAHAVRALLGEGARLAPRLWPTHVAPVEGAGGWPPHLDATKPIRLREDGSPERLTVWIALSDATVDNGCMYVVPRDVAGVFPASLFQEREADATGFMKLLHAARALPVPAGDAVCWTKDVVHWGGVASGDGLGPRVSLATEFMQKDAHADVGEGAALDVFAGVPSFEERVRLVGRQLKKYVAYEQEAPALTPLQSLADEMLHV